MSGGGEHAHVGADLSDHRLSGAGGDAGDRGGQRDGRLPGRAQLGLDRLRQLGDVLVQEVQVREDRTDDQRVVGLKAALERFFELGELLAQKALGEVGEHLGIGGAGHQRVEHRPPGDAEDVGGDAVELDAGVLQRLVQPVRFALTLSDLCLAVPRQRPEPPLRLGRDEATAQQPGLHQLAEPLGVLDVGLAAGDNQHHRLHELRSSLPGEVTVTAAYHPLCGERLAVEGRRRVGGAPCLIVRLPDGTPGTIEVQATSACSAAGEAAAGAGALLSAEGVRQLRRLLAPTGGEGSGT
jgi:hypothetical protein